MLIFYQADDSHEMSRLFYNSEFKKKIKEKIECNLLQILFDALRVKTICISRYNILIHLIRI